VTALGTGESYTYDANGNMITRVEGGLTYTQTFDAENRLISVAVSGQTTQFIYDGDGNLVKKIKPDGSKTLYVGGIYEVDKTSGGTVTGTKTYYPAAGAMRVGSTLYYVLKDHLGSASVVTDASGNTISGGEARYYPFGEARFSTSSIPTDRLFTGQREITGLGIYHYGARFYSPKLGRFLSADSIVPGYANPQSLNRYSYVNNNPLRYVDPTGHRPDDGYVGNHNSTNCAKYPQYCNSHDEGSGGGGNSGGCNTLASCNESGGGNSGGSSGGGGQTLSMPNFNQYYYQLTLNTLYSTPTLPPAPCAFTDCVLSIVGFASSLGTFALPPWDLVATGVDFVVTLWAIGRTEEDYSQGKISNTRRWILDGTGLVGLAPAWLGPQYGFIGTGASFFNMLVTFSGTPN
jgi:RHS repeat-associated protein